ncbi:Golgi integral membrane protein 4-like isoform X2 [Myxocyprinus asiaticus]|uniref:Golgi integral membrane protein 4-like isoform X2 n=1 Tax=Myxocyprinus asiaticus TaxID=70543 RepID=UPI0022221CD5|nr:Golgi integral membrane protein 4-like isoform X2 [Myxocyprinus asiaticus]
MRNFGVVSVLRSEKEIPLRKVSVESRRGATMGNGVCSRKQKKIFQSLLLVTVVFGMIYGGMVSYEMHKELKRTEAMALNYQQHQESLSAQLQVVYEHRSRLEKSLQKERLEHKKAKDDYLVYKLEAQQSLNKEKQDTSVRFNSLHAQHQMLKNQHNDLKKQYYELQEQHQLQGDEHNKAIDEHKQKLDQLHQAKETEISKLKDNVNNLREENKQLRKAHQEIYVQLQDTRQQHKNLKSAHDQLVLTLEDHKGALAAAQVQVNEYKQLKETLNKMPSLRQTARQPQTPVAVQPVQNGKPENPGENHQPQDTQLQLQKTEEVEKPHPPQLQHKEEDGEMGGAEERRRELAEEEMEQAGQPQKLEEEFDLAQSEVEEEPHANQPDENALAREEHQAHQEVAPAEVQVQHAQVERVKSAYEQQQEQQRLVAQLTEERRQLHLRQEALQRQQLQQQKEREEQLRLQREREEQQNREADLKEQQLQQEMIRKKSQYENMDADIIQGEEDPHIAEENEGNIHHEEPRQDGEEHVHHEVEEERPVEADVDPKDDPNNQGEDEFEEAEQQQPQEEEPAPVGRPDMHLPREHQHQPHAGEQLVMAGNPDQQEDTLDEQYQEDGDDEAQDELLDNQKPAAVIEEEGDPYNEENGELEEARHQDVAVKGDKQPAQDPNAENYEEEEEEEEGNGDKPPHRRAEM